MTLTTPRPLSLSVPCTQNTAPILEFRCLYTHDIRRKSKRWQDGFLRFHTFNRRLMVYDLPRNFVGDSHWRETADLADGDEFELERHGILVQVGEALGKTEQDLSVLFEKRVKDREQKLQGINRFKTPLRAPGAARALSPPIGRTANPTHPSTRTLSSILQTPSRVSVQAAWPGISPFEQRHENNEGRPKERSSKKRKVRDEDESLSSNPVVERGSEIQEKQARKKTRRKAVRTNGGLGSIAIVDVSDNESTPRDRPNTSEQLEEPKDTTSVVPPAQNRRANHLLQKSANPLRLAGRPARKKLLCQDLSSPTRPTLTSRPINNAPHPRRQSPSPPPCAQSEELSKFHQAQTERLQARLKRSNEGSKEPSLQDHGREKSYPTGNPRAAAKQAEAPYAQKRLSRVDNTRPPPPQQQNHPLPNRPPHQQKQKQRTTTQRPSLLRAQPISRPESTDEPSNQAVGGAGATGAWSIETRDLLDWRRPTSPSESASAGRQSR